MDVVKLLCESVGIPAPLREYRFHPARRWRLDYAWPDQKIGIEVEGGVWIYGRHNRPKGYLSDMAKYNSAVTMGWRILRYTPAQMQSGEFLRDVMQLWQ